MNKENITAISHEFCRKFQARFGSLLCNELRTQGFRPDNPPHLCENITKKAVAFSAQYILEEIGMAC